MRTILTATILSLPLLAAPAQAFNCLGPVNVDAGAGGYLNVNFGGPGAAPRFPAAPWYTYFPYPAYFQLPAPVGGYPYWPAPPVGVAAPTDPHPPPPLSQAPPRTPPPAPPSGFQPVVYDAQVPSYWYGR